MSFSVKFRLAGFAFGGTGLAGRGVDGKIPQVRVIQRQHGKT